MAIFSYSISRPVTMPWFTQIMLSLGFIYVIIITLINVVSVGYDTVTYSSTDFNGTHGLWYDKFIPNRGPDYSHRSCVSALLKLNDYISTNSYFNFFLYQLVDFIDPTHVGATNEIDGVNYTNNAFHDCSISALQLTEYLQPISPDLKAPAIIACNTSSSKYLYLQTAADAGVDEIDIASLSAFEVIENYPGPVDIVNAITIWGVIARKLWYTFSRDQSSINMLNTNPSLLRQSLIAIPGLSYIRFAYSDTLGGTTPANGSWTMFVSYLNDSAVGATGVPIVFTSTGQVDTTLTSNSSFQLAQGLLAPTISNIDQLAAAKGVANIDFWELINWLFVSHYWALLLDVGQISPATFHYDNQGNFIDYGPIEYPATNNIFVNETLFGIYEAYLHNTIVPLFGYHLPAFNPLNDTNRMNASDVSLRLLYTCTDLQLKSAHSLVINLMVADWAFITSLLTIGLIIGTWWTQRKDEEANHCEGCTKLRREHTFGLVSGAGSPMLEMPQAAVVPIQAAGNGVPRGEKDGAAR